MEIIWYRPVPPDRPAALSACLGRAGPGLRTSRRPKKKKELNRVGGFPGRDADVFLRSLASR